MEEGSLFCGLMAASYRAWAERERGSYLKAVRVEYVVKSGRPPPLACAGLCTYAGLSEEVGQRCCV